MRTDLALHVADQDHPRDLVRLLALLVDERKVHVQLVGNRGRAEQRGAEHERAQVGGRQTAIACAMQTPKRGVHGTYRLAPPASGETITTSLRSDMLVRMYLSILGSAYRLSTGMSKKPCTARTAYARYRPISSCRPRARVQHKHEREADTDLDLGRVEIHRDDMVSARHHQHVGDQLGRDRCAALVLW